MGILNETHEPNTFYGVERNNVEKNIIPTTWWEAGLALGGRIGKGWSWDATGTSGLLTSAADGYKPRAGHQKVAKAVANDGALTGRLKWTGVPGAELAATFQYQSDITPGHVYESCHRPRIGSWLNWHPVPVPAGNVYYRIYTAVACLARPAPSS